LKKFALYICIVSLSFSSVSNADEVAPEEVSQNAEFKSLFWTPLASVLIPGLGQAIDGDTRRSFVFGGLALTGYGIYSYGDNDQKAYLAEPGIDFNRELDNKLIKRVGGSMILNAGFMSAYDTFQSRIGVYQEVGKYLFLPKDQKVEDFTMAPFHFSYLQRPTTWIPFLVSMVISADHYNTAKPTRFHMRGIDPAAAAYLSYNAGTGEEAYFRGVLYPTLYESWNGGWTANVAQALIFGYAHGERPYPQILGGLYFGYLAEKNGFDLGENIFIHAWWDVWLMMADFIKDRGYANGYYFQLPQINIRF
jgi:membrane protease YdiL (CAAX protease family)